MIVTETVKTGIKGHTHQTISRTRSPDHRRSRSRSTDRHRRKSHHRTPFPDHSRKRRRYDNNNNKRTAAVVSDFVDEIVKEKQQKSKKDKEVEVSDSGEMDADEIDMMKMRGIPVGFDLTKGKHVEGNDVSGIRVVTKQQPRQYMNRRGGFNRPLLAEVNLLLRSGFCFVEFNLELCFGLVGFVAFYLHCEKGYAYALFK
uniref:U4/U6.U5 small nuclear ribonucleoprotein 27kDa protein domain-containing protein n=1 Tax=Helianthus annuus TaxID=4232 RepID=A0A251U283_HELAN